MTDKKRRKLVGVVRQIDVFDKKTEWRVKVLSFVKELSAKDLYEIFGIENPDNIDGEYDITPDMAPYLRGFIEEDFDFSKYDYSFGVTGIYE